MSAFGKAAMVRVMRGVAVGLACLALPLGLSACGGSGAKPNPKTLTFGAEARRSTTVTFGGLRAVRINLFNGFTEKYTIEATGTTCEGATAAALTKGTCMITFRKNGGGGSLIAIRDETNKVLENVWLE